MSLWKVIPVLVFSMAAFAGDGTGGLPNGMLAPCNDKDTNIKNLQSGNYNQVPQTCRDQIQSSLKNCFTPPEASDDAEKALLDQNSNGQTQQVSNVGISGSAVMDGQSSQLGVQKYNARSNTCVNERSQSDDVCKQAQDHLKQALSDNSKAEQQAQTQLGSMPGDDPGRPALLKQLSNLRQTGLSLQTQISATNQARENIANTLSEEATCDVNQASIYQNQVNAAQGALQATNSSGQSTASQLAQDAVNKVTEPAEGYAIKTGINMVEEAEPALESAGGVAFKMTGPGVAAANDDPLGIVTGTTQLAVTSIDADMGVVAGRLLGPVGAYFGSISPTSSCDTVITDAVQAYKMNCTVNSPAGATANESAIGTLAQQ